MSAEELIDAEDPGMGKSRRLTDAEFAEVREVYELGTAGLTDLADKHGISRQALSKRFKDAGVVKGARAAEIAEAAKKAAAVGATGAAAASTVDRFEEKREQWVEESRVGAMHNMVLVERLTKKAIQEALAKSAPLSTIDDELKAIERIKKIFIETGRHKLVDILNAAELIDEDNLPSLILEDLTDQEIIDHHRMIDESLGDDVDLADIIGVDGTGEDDF